jgi:hypothetical protein
MASAPNSMPAMKWRIRCDQVCEYKGGAPVMLPLKNENDAHTLTTMETTQPNT